jgi:hypothetical protein
MGKNNQFYVSKTTVTLSACGYGVVFGCKCKNGIFY